MAFMSTHTEHTQSGQTDRPYGMCFAPVPGPGRWPVLLAMALPLAAVCAMTALGIQTLVAQAREDARALRSATVRALAAQCHVELNQLLQTLSLAAQHGTQDQSTLPGFEHAIDFAFHTMEQPPSDHLALQAFRQASGVGWAVRILASRDPGRLILAAADHPGDATRIALVELPVAALLERVGPVPPGGRVILYDRELNPLTCLGLADNGHSADIETRPVPEHPLHVGLLLPVPGTSDIAAGQGTILFTGGAACALATLCCAAWILLATRRRMADADRRREQAMREMEHVQKLSSIGRLAAGVAHEINNPLAIIAEKAGLMKDLACACPDLPRMERFATLSDAVLQSVQRCRAVTHRLLGFARRMEVHAVELDVNDVLREVLGFLEREALHRNVRLDLELDPGLPPIESDRGQLQQVFLNLCNNAMAAVDDHGRIRVGTRRDNGTVRVEVEDNGVGISQENLHRIFEPFFSTKGEKGTGLGLSITYGIVNKLGGSITVASEPGKGTLFTVRLPRHGENRIPNQIAA